MQPHLESFTWITCVSVLVCECAVVMWRGVSPVAALFHLAPESAVGRETSKRQGYGRQVNERGIG